MDAPSRKRSSRKSPCFTSDAMSEADGLLACLGPCVMWAAWYGWSIADEDCCRASVATDIVLVAELKGRRDEKVGCAGSFQGWLQPRGVGEGRADEDTSGTAEA